MKLLNDLTIVVPSFNRQSYLLRLLKYWSGKGPKVLAFDGSPTPIGQTAISGLSSNIKYFHQPNSLYERLRTAVGLVSSKYVMLATDDEFYIPSALHACINELENDNELVSCGGRAISFGFDNCVWGESVYEKLANLNLSELERSDRVYKHFSNYVPAHLYAVSHSSKWVPIARQIFSDEYDFFAAWELQFEFMLPYVGKTRILDNLLWLRSCEAEPIRDTSPSMSENITINNWWRQDVFLRQKEEFLYRMGKLSEDLGLKFSDFTPDFTAAISIYIHNNYDYHENRILTLRGKLRKYLFSFIPPRLKKIFKKVIHSFRFRTREKLPDALERMKGVGVIVDLNEVAEVEYLIRQHHA